MDNDDDSLPTPLLPRSPIDQKRHDELKTFLMALAVARSRIKRLQSLATPSHTSGDTDPYQAALGMLDDLAIIAGVLSHDLNAGIRKP